MNKGVQRSRSAVFKEAVREPAQRKQALVMLSLEDFNSLEGTAYLLRSPGMIRGHGC